MEKEKTIEAITERYNELAESSCCLSCGGAARKAGVRKGEVVVDLGSGRGNDVLRLAEDVGADGFVYGVDASPEMIKKAQETQKKLGVNNAAFLESELEKLPLASSTADCVVSNCTINHASDKQAVWQEIARILKPGGRFIISDIYASQPVPEEYKNDPAAVAECWAGSQTKNEYLETVLGAGFTNVHIMEESDPYPKGNIEVSSFTIAGEKRSGCSCSGGSCC
ncbi:MAG: methyltransferase domain-containing protein [Spirochaetales bacterium]|nr:methyltransferase domain-containing protein [Spirochaetales bacterium]